MAMRSARRCPSTASRRFSVSSAFLYSIGYIPFTSAMTRWHFWLSFVSVLVCFSGAAIFYRYVSSITDTTDTRLGPGGMLLAASFAAGLVTFVSMQLWFTVDLAR